MYDNYTCKQNRYICSDAIEHALEERLLQDFVMEVVGDVGEQQTSIHVVRHVTAVVDAGDEVA